jgi:polyphosphate kinase
MHRNIYERVEVMFHLENDTLRETILREVVAPYLADTEQTRILMSDGRYVHAQKARGFSPSKNGTRFNAQQFFVDFAQRNPDAAELPLLPKFIRAAARGTPSRATR